MRTPVRTRRRPCPTWPCPRMSSTHPIPAASASRALARPARLCGLPTQRHTGSDAGSARNCCTAAGLKPRRPACRRPAPVPPAMSTRQVRAPPTACESSPDLFRNVDDERQLLLLVLDGDRVAHEVVGEAALGAETQLIERQHLMYRKFKPPFFCSELYR